jgi:hypothetical protein
MWDPSQLDPTRATLYLILMKKMTTQKNPRKPQREFKCPQCGKSFQNAQGLSGHVRYLHPKPKRPAATIPQPAAKQRTKVGASALVPSTAAHEHLQAAFAVLSQRGPEIEAEIARLEALKAEKEIIQRELEAVKAALKVFSARESPADEKVETERAQGSTLLDTREAAGANADASPGGQPGIFEAATILKSTASHRDRQRTVAQRANTSQDGQSRRPDAGKAPEFTGNKTEFVRAVVQSRGSVGAAPKDINQVFVERRIEKSKNAIYNALESLVRQKKLTKKEGQYFSLESANA